MTTDQAVDTSDRLPEGQGRVGRAVLPRVDIVLGLPGAADLIDRFGRSALRSAVRARLAELRDTIGDSDRVPGENEVLARARCDLEDLARAALRPVINATGVVLHTNLGRAPLSEDAVRAVIGAANYSTVELDLVSGARGSRTAHASSLVSRLLGAEHAHVVNNGAAALLLAVAALARGRDVIVSRGELIEIGGSFRLPDIIAMSGARLVEVGTTNRTRSSDYRAAIGAGTGLILKVHPSNFRQVGFTEEAELSDLVRIGEEHDIPVVHDVGSGLLGDLPTGMTLSALDGEPTARASLAAGVDIVLFSGDKLLGGPQAGIIAGSRPLVDACRTSPMARALRIDKLQIAALEATLAAHLRSDQPLDLPAVRMLHLPVETLRTRAKRLLATLAGITELRDVVTAEPLEGRVGGGASPEATLASYGLAIGVETPGQFLTALRLGDPTVIARVSGNRVLIDLRTVAPEDDDALVHALARAAAGIDGALDGR